MCFKYLVSPFIFISLSVLALSSFAEKMDLDTHTAVIEKLTVVTSNLDESDASKTPSTLRLADLLAERARLKNLKEVEQNCDNCLKSKEDRLLAVSHYNYVISRLTDDIRGTAMLQKAHLHLILGQMKETEKVYQQVTKEGEKKHSQNVIGQAHAAYGDLYFQKAEFKKAKEQYEKALSIKQTPNKGLVHYRLAWCLFNLDQVKNSIAKMEMILTTPELTQVHNGDEIAQDESFKIDVAKDLASFYARTKITKQTVAKLTHLSPNHEKINNLYFLATEADRLGKKKESALVWLIYLDQSGKDKNALEAQIRLMRLRRDTGDVTASLAIFDNVKKLMEDPGCDKNCDLYQSQIKSWITDWSREEKKNQTPELTQAYVQYTQIFPNDEEMFFSGAIAAKQRKQLSLAYDLFKQAADVSHKNLRKADDKQTKALLTIRDQSLVAQMDISETLKDSKLRFMAYMHYLELQPKGSQEFEVRYQLAQLEFEDGKYQKSADSFRYLALEKINGKKELQKSAADMSLEALIKIKNEPLIQKWSLDYAQNFKNGKAEYESIHRKAVLNSTATNINAKRASNDDLKTLMNVSLAKATPQEKVIYYKNAYLLALQLHNFPEAKKANQSLLNLKEIKATDKEEAIRNRIWLAEMELDFKTAYTYTKQTSGRMTADKAFRLLGLAEMARIDASQHENEFLKLSKDQSLRASVIVGKVQRSAHPIKTVTPYIKELSKTPKILGRLSLEIYSRTNNKEILEKSLQYSAVKKSSYGVLITRLLKYPTLNKEIAALQKMKLDIKNQNSLKKSLEARLKKMSQFETNVNAAIRSRDIVLQAITLDVLMLENQRLYNDLLNLPVPRGLKTQDLQQYKAILEQQALPFKKKAGQIYDKLVSIWTDKTWTEQIAQNYIDARFEYKPALKQDIQELMKHSPSGKKAKLQAALSESIKIPTERAVLQVQDKVRQNPFETKPVVELKDLASKRGNDILVSHLEGRLDQMRKVNP